MAYSMKYNYPKSDWVTKNYQYIMNKYNYYLIYNVFQKQYKGKDGNPYAKIFKHTKRHLLSMYKTQVTLIFDYVSFNGAC